MSESIQPIPLKNVLESVSNHLDMLAGQIFNVEEALSELVANDSRANGLSITKFQSLDFARQSLEDCALLLLFLSRETSGSSILVGSSDACETLKLASTKSLIHPNICRDPFDRGGDLDLFE
jgi:hypothetical protein